MTDAAHSFSAIAAEYARRRPHYPPEIFTWIAAQAPGRRLAWDAATGNGQAAIGLAQHFAAVYAVDHSAEQIAAAPAHPRVSYYTAPAEICALPSGSCDAVTVAQALHWFDLPTFFSTVERVLRPGGLFCAWGYSFAHVMPAVDAVIERAVLTPLAPFWAAQNRLLWDNYRSITIPLPELPTPAWQLTLQWNCDDYLAYLATWSAVQRARPVLGNDWWPHICDNLAAVWGNPREVRSVFLPLAARAARRPSR
jgi:SAM-dependent methyltransferase